MRYDRQMILPEIGEEGQLKLKKAKVLIVGVGGLGSPIALYLAGAGVGCIGLVDDDRVSISNLQRQVLYSENELDKPKAVCAAERLSALNSGISILPYSTRLTEENAGNIIRKYDIIVDGCDNFATRYLINDICIEQRKPYVYGAICGFEGQVSVFNYGEMKKSYRDLYPNEEEMKRMPPPPKGVIGVTPAVVGSIEATEVLKIICGFGDILAGYFAKCMGLPVGKLLCASNANNVLTEFLTTGRYDRRRPFHKTISPSMDILVSSNLERLLYLASGVDADMVAEKMHQLEQRGWYQIDDDLLQKIQETFLCGCCDDPLTCETIRNVWAREHYLLDPHTAVAWAVAGQHRATLTGQTVVLSTASPYKFAPAVLAALGKTVPDDAFAAMDELQALTGLAAPAPLAELKSLPILHRDCIEISEMADYVRRNMED